MPLIHANIAEVEFGSLHVLTEAVLVGGRPKTKKERPLNHYKTKYGQNRDLGQHFFAKKVTFA